MTELRRKGRPLQADTSATKGAQALDRGLEILQYLAISGGSATVSILSDKLALPLSTTFRLLKVLERSRSSYFKIRSLVGGTLAFSLSLSDQLI